MQNIRIDGESVDITEGATIDDILPDRDPSVSIAVIRPITVSRTETRQFLFKATAGEVVIETTGSEHSSIISRIRDELRPGWLDLQAISFGPFPTDITPVRRPSRYERGDLAIGCGGYDPNRSYLIFSKKTHAADHGSPEYGGIIGKVVSGRGVIERLSSSDRILSIEPVISFAESTQAFTTTDGSQVISDGMHLITHIRVQAEGFSLGRYNADAATSVDLLLLALKTGAFTVDQRLHSHIRSDILAGTDVQPEVPSPRREGAVFLRTNGKRRGSVYIYTEELPKSLSHTLVGNVVHGIELAKIATDGDKIAIKVEPDRFDLVGMPLEEAKEQADASCIELISDDDGPDLVVIGQEPVATLEVLASGSVIVKTVPYSKVIDIMLDDTHAPHTSRVFREVSGLKYHDVGALPLMMVFEGVYLFKTNIPKKNIVNPENSPEGVVQAGILAMTNDSCKGVGMIGVRTSLSTEYGPTSEPFSGTNIIGKVLSMEKLSSLKEKDNIWFREVRR